MYNFIYITYNYAFLSLSFLLHLKHYLHNTWSGYSTETKILLVRYGLVTQICVFRLKVIQQFQRSVQKGLCAGLALLVERNIF